MGLNLWMRREGQRRRLVIRAASLGAAILLGWTVAAPIAANALVVRAPLDHPDALLVFSGAPVHEERVAAAAQLFLRGRAPTILLTDDGTRRGWSRQLQRRPTSVELALLQLKNAGVPDEAVHVLPGVVSSTFDEATAVARYAEHHAVRTLLGVTSSYHTRRALWTLQRVLDEKGIRVGVEPAVPGPRVPRPSTWWWQERGWYMVAGEYVKLAYYKLHYG